MKKFVALVALVALSGCAVTGSTGGSCKPLPVGPAPTYADTDDALLAARGPSDRYHLLAIGRSQRISRVAALEAAACQTHPSHP